jgi:MurNAc alpha-1-phosphate uridylyltransferase
MPEDLDTDLGTRPPRALILAAGRGERMRPLTDTCPKPLLTVRGKPLIAYHLEALARAGVREVAINGAWLEQQLPEALGDGSRWGLSIHYAFEGRDHGGALETAGGIANLLPWLTAPSQVSDEAAFWVVAGDVFLPGFDFPQDAVDAFVASPLWAQLWLVPNAPHHPRGDFAIGPGQLAQAEVSADSTEKRTWASVGLFKPDLFADVVPGTRLALRPKLDQAMAVGRLGAVPWSGPWTDVGTVERLAALNRG